MYILLWKYSSRNSEYILGTVSAESLTLILILILNFNPNPDNHKTVPAFLILVIFSSLCVRSTTHTTTCRHGQALFSWQSRWQILSDWVASPPFFIITDLASPPSLQPLLFLTFSDIYPPPQWQRPAHSHRPAWVLLCGLVCWMSWSTSKTEWERRGGQTAKSESERKQNTEYKAHPRQLFFTQRFISIICTTHKRTHTHSLRTNAACALIWVCLRPPSMTSSWEKRTRSEGGQDRQRKSRKAVNK